MNAGHPVASVFSEAYRGGSWGVVLDADEAVLDLCSGPTLDVGCGPGRMTRLLAERGAVVLGIDVVPEAVWRTRDRGGAAMLRDVFDRVPAEGRWGTVLLADGNVGIGGDPGRLFTRLRHVLEPGGLVVADVAPPGTGLRVGTACLTAGGLTSEPFPWAVVGADAVGVIGREAGYATTIRQIRGRWVAVLEADAA